MNKGILGSLFLLLAGVALALGQLPKSPPPPDSDRSSAPAPSARAGLSYMEAEDQAVTPAVPPAFDTHPWNPPVPHANVWPYPAPVAAGVPDCGPPGDFCLRANYLLWGIKGFQLPALATATSSNPARAGSELVLGGCDLDNDVFHGGRFTAATVLNDAHTLFFEGGYFFLAKQSNQATLTSPGGPDSPVLARPFLDVLTGGEAAFLVASPSLGAGGIKASADSSLQGAEANAVCQLYCCPQYRVEALVGFRWEDLSEGLEIRSAGEIAPGVAVFGGHEVGVIDQFITHNSFFGGQIGARAEYYWHHFVVNLRTDLALGGNAETIKVSGATLKLNGKKRTVTGGLLALPTNSGRFHDSEFAVIPEVGIQIGYQFNPQVRAFVGYDFQYWSDVARPGDQIDLGVNPLRVPAFRTGGPLTGPARPAFSAQQTDFWAQGLEVGLEVRY
jgi:hypothetical protein